MVKELNDEEKEDKTHRIVDSIWNTGYNTGIGIGVGTTFLMFTLFKIILPSGFAFILEEKNILFFLIFMCLFWYAWSSAMWAIFYYIHYIIDREKKKEAL